MMPVTATKTSMRTENTINKFRLILWSILLPRTPTDVESRTRIAVSATGRLLN